MYSSIAQARTRAIAASGVQSPETAYVDELLEIYTALLPDGETVEYRPFIVAAKLLEQDTKRQRLIEADGAKFGDLQPKIDSLYAQQRTIDSALKLILSEGTEAHSGDCDPCGRTPTEPRRPVSIRTVLY